MIEILFFALGFVAIGIAVFFACKNRHNAQQCIAAITLGVFFATFFMVLPTEWVKEGKSVFCQPLYATLSSLLYSLKALGGRQDIAQLETVALPAVLKGIYIVVAYICFALAPILASSLILSFVGDTGDKLRFILQRSPKCYVFSEINENALALAEGIKNKPGKKTLVFCDGKTADKALVVKAKKAGAIVLHKSCDALTVGSRFATYEFYLISTDEDRNITKAETIIAKYGDTQKAKILINAFVESGTNVKFLESVVQNKGEKANIELHCVDEIALFCNHLVYKHPLFDPTGNNKTISVVIVGCGRTGMRMLKTAYWAGQISDYALKIRVYDKDKACAERFYRQCPGLKEETAIQFITADVDTADFGKQLLKTENSADATYIVIAMGNDQLNLSVADELFRIYRRHFDFQDSRAPRIFARVRSQAATDNYSGNAEFLESRNIHLFGTTGTIFSNETLFNTELENLAFAVHLAYDGKLALDKTSSEYQQERKQFKNSEYNRRSSMATALHIPAKLHMCIGACQEGEQLLTEKNLKKYANALAEDPQLLESLAKNEHARWNAFFLSEGYQQATVTQMLQYAQAVGEHKDELSLLHPCITDWDSLETVQDRYNTAYGESKNFKKYDKIIVEKVPVIWAVAQQMNGEN